MAGVLHHSTGKQEPSIIDQLDHDDHMNTSIFRDEYLRNNTAVVQQHRRIKSSVFRIRNPHEQHLANSAHIQTEGKFPLPFL